MKGSAAMPAKVLMDVDEYLHASFDGPDCEYLDGEVVERNRGEKPHSKLQMELAFLLRGMAPKLGIQVLPEIRIQVSPRRYRVATSLSGAPARLAIAFPLCRRSLPSRSSRPKTASPACSPKFRITSPSASSASGWSIPTSKKPSATLNRTPRARSPTFYERQTPISRSRSARCSRSSGKARRSTTTALRAPSTQAEMRCRLQHVPVIRPDFRKTLLSCRHQMDGIARSNEDACRESLQCLADIP